jgi:predicted RNA methylase
MSKISMMDFLEVIVEDNFTYDFPVNDIRMELTNMLISQEEFQYFTGEAYKKLKRNWSKITADIFTTILSKKFNDVNFDPQELTYEEYVIMMDEVIETLEKIKITRIPPESPDYEVLKEMAKY